MELTASSDRSYELAQQLTALLGCDRVRAPRGNEAVAAAIVVEPRDVGEIVAIVRKCEQERISLAPIGAAGTLAQIRREPIAVALSLAQISRVIAYEPADMTIVTEAGITLDALDLLTAEKGQRLPVDPPAPAITTVGSLIAGAKAGPLRLSEGAVRDLLIGIRFVGHGGRIIHAGGRVVKNVAGYDLMKVLTGSYGTLGIITEAAFKVRPIPPRYHLAVAALPSSAAAFAAADRIGAVVPLIHCEVVSAAFSTPITEPGAYNLYAGFGGIQPEINEQRERIVGVLGSAATVLEETEAASAYITLRDMRLTDASMAAQLAVMPAELARCVAACGGEFRAHALSGIAQLFLTSTASPAEILAEWRQVARSARGHVRVLRTSPGARPDAMFDTPPPAAMALMRRLKAAFDPHGVFNPNCFVGGL